VIRSSESRRRHEGQGLVEFAFVLPVFLALLLGTVDLGRGIWANNSVASAAREAARFAAVHGGSKSSLCPVGPPVTGTTQIPIASPACPYPSPSRQAIIDVATGFLVAGGTNVVVTVCYGNGCTGNTDIVGATNARGTPVTVVVASQVPMIMGTFLGLGTINVSGTSTMLVNH
jgi:Flp pilus assembly protein TadG